MRLFYIILMIWTSVIFANLVKLFSILFKKIYHCRHLEKYMIVRWSMTIIR